MVLLVAECQEFALRGRWQVIGPMDLLTVTSVKHLSVDMVTKPQELLPDNLTEFMRNVSVQLVSMATSLTLIPTTNQQQEYPKQENGGQKNIIKTMSSKLTELCKNHIFLYRPQITDTKLKGECTLYTKLVVLAQLVQDFVEHSTSEELCKHIFQFRFQINDELIISVNGDKFVASTIPHHQVTPPPSSIQYCTLNMVQVNVVSFEG
ncbi:hypothetical protein LSH36_1708g00000 [Paralvinella palmiformis]|uniref:Uncharacterized protein n=1 Tax=Paralvinella palmiformis TaxID=53620 RepID=A0AAD9IS03_9ANNE|nr:hypothetical protein LSH36_1708g00000 [Paralvinella palmiformis]